MKTILRNVLIAFILILTMGSTLASAETPAKEQPVDQSNVIFKGCQLGNLVKKDLVGQPLTKEQIDGTADANGIPSTNISETGKQDYLKGCIQDIIRFIIVIASLAAILKIAASGLAMLDPSGSKMSQKLSSKSTITNLVIGLFLLIVGWNLIPILNASFNNVDFLNIPGTDHCSLESSNCTTIYSIQASDSKRALDKFIQAQKDQKIVMLPTDLKETIENMEFYCKNEKEKDKYKAAYKKAGLDKPEYIKICASTTRVADLEKWYKAGKDGASGTGGDFASAAIAYKARADVYATAIKKKDTAAIIEAAKTALITICSEENMAPLEKIAAPRKPEEDLAINNCKKIRDPKTLNATLAEIAK
jgi:hypothetical protein